MTVGSAADNCRGAQNAIAPRSSTAPFFIRHCFSSRPLNRDGKISFRHWPLRLRINTRAASCVASRTSACVSPKQTSKCSRIPSTYGSNSTCNVPASISYANKAPCRIVDTLVSSIASASLVKICSSRIEHTPRPFTMPAKPYAAPRRVAYFSPCRRSTKRSSTMPGTSLATAVVRTSTGKQEATASCTSSLGVRRAESRRSTTRRTCGLSAGRY